MTHSLTLELPERVYKNLAEKASKNGKPIEEFVAQDIISRVATIRNSVTIR